MVDEDKKNQPAVDKQKLQERILRSVKPSMGDATSKWVVNLKQGVTDQVEVPLEFDENQAAQYPCDMRSWVDKMFDDVQRYQVEYNREQKDQNMVIQSERPVFMQSGGASGASHMYTGERGSAQHFQGHLYTRSWALLIRGETHSIKAWMLPVDFLLGFDGKDDEFTPYLEMRGAANKNGLIIWHIDAVPVPFEATGAISKALFSAMVRATKKEFDSKEKFSVHQTDLAAEIDTKALQRYTIAPGSSASHFLLKPEDVPPPAPPQPNYGYPGQMPYPPQGGYAPQGYPPQGAPGYPPGYGYPPQGAPGYPPPPGYGYPPQGAPGYAPQPPNYQPHGQPTYPPQSAPGYPPPQPQGYPQQPPAHQPVSPPQAPVQPPHPAPEEHPAPAPSSPPQSASARFENAPPTASGILKQIRPDLIDPNTGHADLLRMSMDENLKQLIWACNSATQSFTAQLEVLSKIGTAASQVHNQKVSDLVSQRMAALSAFKENLESFASQLNSMQ